MGVSEAQMKAVHKYTTKNYYRPCVMLRREYEQALREKADKEGKSVSTYIQDLIKKDLGVKEGE